MTTMLDPKIPATTTPWPQLPTPRTEPAEAVTVQDPRAVTPAVTSGVTPAAVEAALATALVHRLLEAQRQVSELLRGLHAEQPEWELREAILQEAARLVQGVALLVDARSDRPVLAGSVPMAGDDLVAGLVGVLAGCEGHATLLEPRLVALQVPGGNEYLVVRSDQDLTAIDLAVLEPLLDLLALLRRSELRRLRADLLAREDPLTGLSNAFALRERISRDQRRQSGSGRPVELLMIRLLDADLNTVLGDALLVAAAAVRQVVREGDMVAHLGGAAFGVLVALASPEDGPLLAARIRTELEALLHEELPEHRLDVQLMPSSDGGSPPRALP